MHSSALSRSARAASEAELAVQPAGEGAGGEASAPPETLAVSALPSVALLLMSRVRAGSVPWAMWRLARGAGSRGAWGATPGLRFAKVLGSGRDGGFGLRPGLDCQGLFVMFDQLRQAQSFLASSAIVDAYRRRALESFSAVLEVTSARGHWSGQGMAASSSAAVSGPIAALTRAAIRPGKAWIFWHHSPPAEASLAAAAGCRLAVGLGEAPLLRQATFSIWQSAAAMDAYAHSGAHQQAIQAAWQGDFFSEWMFVRFKPHQLQGSWQGQDLARLLSA